MLQCMFYTGPGYRVQIYDIKPKQVQHVLSTTDDQLEPLKLDYFVKSWRSKSKGYLIITGTNDLAECVNDAFFIQVHMDIYLL